MRQPAFVRVRLTVVHQPLKNIDEDWASIKTGCVSCVDEAYSHIPMTGYKTWVNAKRGGGSMRALLLNDTIVLCSRKKLEKFKVMCTVIKIISTVPLVWEVEAAKNINDFTTVCHIRKSLKVVESLSMVLLFIHNDEALTRWNENFTTILNRIIFEEVATFVDEMSSRHSMRIPTAFLNRSNIIFDISALKGVKPQVHYLSGTFPFNHNSFSRIIVFV